MITSTKNDQVKAVIELKKKARARNEQGLFVVEGVRITRDTNLAATLCLR